MHNHFEKGECEIIRKTENCSSNKSCVISARKSTLKFEIYYLPVNTNWSD